MLASRERLLARQGQSGTPRHEYLQQLVSEYTRSQHWLRKEEIVANLANFAYDPINYAALRQLRVVELFVEIVATYGGSAEGASHTGDVSAREHHTGSCGDRRVSNGRLGESAMSAAKSQRLLVEFALGGICNCIPDPTLQLALIESHGVAIVVARALSVTLDQFRWPDSDPDAGNDAAEAGFDATAALDAQKSELNAALSALATVYFLLDSPAFLEISNMAMRQHMEVLSGHPNTRIANIAKAYLSRYEELLLLASASTD